MIMLIVLMIVDMIKESKGSSLVKDPRLKDAPKSNDSEINKDGESQD